MLDAERSVVLTGGEHHQDVLWCYTPERGRSRRVAIELVPVGARLEARLNGERVGELSALMSLRYGQMVDGVLRRGERPGCVARIALGKRGVEVELRLPAVNAAGGPPTEQLPVITAATKPSRRSRTPLWVGVAVVGLLLVIGGLLGWSRYNTPSAAPVTTASAPTTTAAPTPTVDAVAASPSVAPTTRPAKPVYYRSCAAVQAAGAAPLHRTDPGYRTGLDPDGDGVACAATPQATSTQAALSDDR